MVDDDAGVRTVLKRILTGAGYQVNEASDAFQALDRLDTEPADALLLDLKMPGMDGLGLLDNLRQRGLTVPVVVLTGHGDQFTARECLEAGAAAYLTKPPDRSDLLLAVRGAVAQGKLAQHSQAAAEPPPLLGESFAIRRLREEIARVAPSRATVLVAGESGTGKELVARRLHHLSERAREAFIRVNCAAIPEELIESELFGHEKGSFTGAHRRQVGKFVQADGGTIFLDEVGDMSLKTQAKVLRVLQDGEVEPVGAEKPFRVDVRVIAATNKDLVAEVKAGNFREDLYYRLAVVVLRTPPLRDHQEDIPLLVEHLTGHFCEEYNRRPKQWSDRALQQLRSYPVAGQRARAQERGRAGRHHGARRPHRDHRAHRRSRARERPRHTCSTSRACRTSNGSRRSRTCATSFNATAGTWPPPPAPSTPPAPTSTRRCRPTASTGTNDRDRPPLPRRPHGQRRSPAGSLPPLLGPSLRGLPAVRPVPRPPAPGRRGRRGPRGRDPRGWDA